MNIEIVDYEIFEEESNKPYVLYVVNCVQDGVNWTVKKRYSEFHDLHKQLCKYFNASEVLYGRILFQ